MSETKDLFRAEAVRELRHIASGEIAMLCTFTAIGGKGMEARPMQTAGIDDDGTCWFLSHKDSGQNSQIAQNPLVNLTYTVPGKSAYMALQGKASVVVDRKKIDEVWNPIAKVWFHEGKDDPAITLVKFVPERGHYWDTKTNRVIEMAKMIFGAITGQTTDDAIQGDLRVS